jgi:hypothetical protein
MTVYHQTHRRVHRVFVFVWADIYVYNAAVGVHTIDAELRGLCVTARLCNERGQH